MTRTNISKEGRLNQGDILSDIECIEKIDENNGVITISKILFPLVIVLTQDCDLNSDYRCREQNKSEPTPNDKRDQDKYLFSVIVAPLYNYELFRQGNHLEDLNQKMQSINSKQANIIKNNETPRYHYLEFDETVPIVNSVIDFKHYFTINAQNLTELKKSHYVCTVSELFRERISQRFANFLSRIGLPELEQSN